MIKTINIAKDFHKAPAGRYRSYGKFSGQRFREEFILPAFNDKKVEHINIILDGLDGVGASFWDEAFGGLIRENNISFETIKSKLSFICNDDITLEPSIWHIIKKSVEE